MLNSEEPLPNLYSPVDLPEHREVVWRNLCLISHYRLECLLEFSRTLHKFYIVVMDLERQKTYAIEMYRQQANKLLRVCDSDLEKVMRLLDFKEWKLIIKNFDIIMNYERFMPTKAAECAKEETTLELKRSKVSLSNRKTERAPFNQRRPQFSHCAGSKETKIKTKLEGQKYLVTPVGQFVKGFLESSLATEQNSVLRSPTTEQQQSPIDFSDAGDHYSEGFHD